MRDPEYVIDASNAHRIRVRVRDDVFIEVCAVADAAERLAGARLAIERLAAHLRRRLP